MADKPPPSEDIIRAIEKANDEVFAEMRKELGEHASIIHDLTNVIMCSIHEVPLPHPSAKSLLDHYFHDVMKADDAMVEKVLAFMERLMDLRTVPDTTGKKPS